MKTSHDIEAAAGFLFEKYGVRRDSVVQLEEGHISQAFSFVNDSGEKRVLRLAPKDEDFLNDKYVYERFGSQLPIPAVRELGKFAATSYYCVSDFVEGVPSNKLSQTEIDAMQNKITAMYAKIFRLDISDTSSFGSIDRSTNDGRFKSWSEYLEHTLGGRNYDQFYPYAKDINVDAHYIDTLVQYVEANMPFASKTRQFIHSDLGFDNMLIKDDKVTALIDWAGVGYGDWLYDYARFDFWWPGRHPRAKDFAEKYDFDTTHIQEREQLYRAIVALTTIRWTAETKNASTAEWFEQHIERIVR